jgi:anti-sigma factor RsiW
VNDTHDDWLRQIDAELDGELSLAQRAALAHHLATCPSCAASRASHLELRVAFAKSHGDPHAHVVPRPVLRGRTLAAWVGVALAAGLLAGWIGHARWGGPGPGTIEASRATLDRR